MVTCFRVGSNRPPKCLNLHVSTISPLPKSYNEAFNDSNWQNAMCDEYNALIKINTWTLVPRPKDANLVCFMWLFRHKHLADGTVSRYKARLVANGSTQLSGIDVDETFSSVFKPATIQTLLSLATSRYWLIIASLHQEFSMADLGSLSYFLGISVVHDSSRMLLFQHKYAAEILERAHMVNCNPSRTPIDTESKLGANGDPISNLTLYRGLEGAL
ncbi:ribonuclease H-like domain-containing protein [Tanacetum coccineum]